MNAADVTAPVEPTAPDSVANHPAWSQLNDQRRWYDAKSMFCQNRYATP